MVDPATGPVTVAHAGMKIEIDLTTGCRPNDLIRRRDPSDASLRHRSSKIGADP
jgi:hypothetical protein